MTTKTNRIEEICRDARELQANALEMLDQGKIRNAAEKAWGATKRATDALVLAREGEEPQPTGQARRALLRLSALDPAFDILQGNITPGQGPAHQLLLRRQLRAGAGDGRPDTGHHPVHRPRREAFQRVIMASARGISGQGLVHPWAFFEREYSQSR